MITIEAEFLVAAASKFLATTQAMPLAIGHPFLTPSFYDGRRSSDASGPQGAGARTSQIHLHDGTFQVSSSILANDSCRSRGRGSFRPTLRIYKGRYTRLTTRFSHRSGGGGSHGGTLLVSLHGRNRLCRSHVVTLRSRAVCDRNQ